MKTFRELVEASETIVFTFGRFNPPTTGHEKLIKKVASVAGSQDFRVYPSHTTNPKKDPLPQSLKIAYMRKMFKKYSRNIMASKAKTAIEIAVELYDQGYKNLTMVVGSDRVKEFDGILSKYNGVEGKKHGYYKFDNIDVVSAGERDPDAEGVEGMSASKMRSAAVEGDKDSFLQGGPSGFKDGEKLYRDVRKHMGIREERDMGDMTDFEAVRDAYLTGKLWNVGDSVTVDGIEGEVVRKGTNYLSYMTEDGKVCKAWLYQIDERNYRKEYDNYQGRPEQIARRSSRNKARRVMGDKTKIGMDVGHKDNNPMNNSPDNLRNEDPSVNRREPRLRDEKYDSDKFFGGKGTPEQRTQLLKLQNKALRALGGSPKQKEIKKEINALRKKMGMKVSEEVNEMTSPLPWLNKAVAKIHQMTHPKGYENLVKKYMDGMKDKDNRAHPSKWAAELARQYRGVEVRDFIRYINKLVDKGKLPQELKAEYTPEHMSFKQFVEVLNKNADQGDYIDDFKDSDAPQFKGKSKKKRIAMAVAAYNDKKRGK